MIFCSTFNKTSPNRLDTTLEEITLDDIKEKLKDRNGGKSTIITSQLPEVKWYKFIGEPILVDISMDSLVGNAYRIELKRKIIKKEKVRKKRVILTYKSAVKNGGSI